MDELLAQLNERIELTDESDELLTSLLNSATALYVRLKYPYSAYPVDASNKPVLDWIAQDWVLRAAIEMFAKLNAEGQVSSGENSVSRSYEAGTISLSLRKEIIPICGVAISANA